MIRSAVLAICFGWSALQVKEPGSPPLGAEQTWSGEVSRGEEKQDPEAAEPACMAGGGG